MLSPLQAGRTALLSLISLSDGRSRAVCTLVWCSSQPGQSGRTYTNLGEAGITCTQVNTHASVSHLLPGIHCLDTYNKYLVGSSVSSQLMCCLFFTALYFGLDVKISSALHEALPQVPTASPRRFDRCATTAPTPAGDGLVAIRSRDRLVLPVQATVWRGR